MKKIVYVIVTLMALTLFVNVHAVSNESTLKISRNTEVVEFNPLY